MRLARLLPLSILFLFSFHTVYSLKCFTCTDPQCTNPIAMQCPAGSACLYVVMSTNNAVYHQVRRCTPQAMCSLPPSNVPPGFSFSQTCCDRDLCNSAVTNKMSLFTAGLLALGSLYVSRL